MSRRPPIRTTLIAALLLTVSACAGSREAGDAAEDADELPTPAVDHAAYEDFDPSAYEEAPLGPAAALEHDVPIALMEGRADEGISSERSGFRVQLHSSLDKSAAVEAEEQVREWWRDEQDAAPGNLFSEEPPVYTVYMQPYYRVRVGNFTSREAAERARQILAEGFPNAFIVPDTVVITR